MSQTALVLLTSLGAVLGAMVPRMVALIVEYKKREKASDKEALLGSGILSMVLCALVMGGAWLLLAQNVKSPLETLLLGLLVFMGTLVTLIDLQVQLIPNELVLLMLINGGLLQILQGGLISLGKGLLLFLAMMVLFLLPALFLGTGKIGAGDVKLAGVMGLALGYPLILTGLILMCGLLVAYIGLGMTFNKLTRYSQFAFGPFMMFGMIGAIFNSIVL